MQQWLRSSKFLLIFLPLWLFISSCIRPLSIPDEGRYGDISRYMLESGDWLIPRINGLPFMHKPPLLHWLSTSLMEIFGVHIWVLRLVPTLAGCMMLFSLFIFLKKHVSEKIAQLTMIILATSLLFYGSSQYINHDLLVASWMTVCILSFVDFTLSGKKTILFLGYFAAAAGFLSKGLIGVLIPGLVLLPWLLYTRQWAKIPALLNPFGILLFLALTVPWIYLVQLKHPQFLHYFFIDQQFSRFSSNEFNNKQPWFFYYLILLVSFLPWFLISHFSFPKQLFKQSLPSSLLSLLLWWFISVSIFFSIPPSKLAGYILPVVAPLAILLAVTISPILDKIDKSKLQIWGTAVFIFILGFGIILTPHIIKNNHDFYMNHAIQIYVIGTILCITPFSLMLLFKQKKIDYLTAIFLSLIVFCTSFSVAITVLDTKNNADQVDFSKLINRNSDVVFYYNYFYDIPFLLDLKKPAYIVNDWDKVKTDNSSLELKDGLLFEPERQQYLWNKQQLQKALDQEKPLLLFSNPNGYTPADPNVKVLHYRNYDVFFINQHP
ncbi:glycosyltransferase family 39 protein [uncultured Acinetobacter sp.]|uniref:ArnT family glycosyltransferase n=1 Tax=uncultured Acinetobacter sp. TaxID=165433 RepID=UPI00258B8F5F|nr:glycosyltransferase family 39 protein [uncultured Acinetobacter sp.]